MNLSFRETGVLKENHVLQTRFFIHPNTKKNWKTQFGNKNPRLRAENVVPDTHLADFLTKSLVAPKFQVFIFKLGMFNIYHASTCEMILKNKESNGRSEEKKLT
jgi:hypothetical protein